MPSATRRAFEKSAKGVKAAILRYFPDKADEEQKAKQIRQATEQTHAMRGDREEYEEKMKKKDDNRRKESQNERQKRFREKLKNEEIARGERDAVTGKRIPPPKLLSDVLVDSSGLSSGKRLHAELAEQTRPKRKIAADMHAANKKPQGRPRLKEMQPAKYVNWHGPLLWPRIEAIVHYASVGPGWSSRTIVDQLQRMDDVYAALSHSTVEGWIDRSGTSPRWSDRALEMARRGHTQTTNGGRRGVLAAYPEVVETVKARLERLRAASAPVSIVTVRGIATATILRMAPEVFEQKAADGSTFRCSDTFLRQFLHGQLNWSLRAATRDGRKLPKDWEAQCRKAILRLAHDIKEYDVPSSLFVNTDQTNMVYAQGTKFTWAKTGSKQVSVNGTEEKRAVTLCVSVSNSGVLLPFQAVYVGETAASLPSKKAPHYEDLISAGMRFENGGSSYWSTQQTMRDLVTDIIAPYFEQMRQEAIPPLPPSQKALWQIDVWSVHRSKEFRGWMRTNHPHIRLHFVPGGCTGALQACDVGIQRPLKHSMKRSYHADVVQEVLDQLDRGEDEITVAKKLPILRDRSVGWIWNAYNVLNRPETVQKVSNQVNIIRRYSHIVQAFEKCEAAGMNLSYESLTSFATREELRQLRETDPAFWEELTRYDSVAELPEEDIEVAEDIEEEDEEGDDSDVPVWAVVDHVLRGKAPTGTRMMPAGILAASGEAESPDEVEEQEQEEQPEDMGRGKRRKVENKRYNGDEFWKH